MDRFFFLFTFLPFRLYAFCAFAPSRHRAFFRLLFVGSQSCLATLKGLPDGKDRIRLGATTVSCHVSRSRNVPRPTHAHTNGKRRSSGFHTPSSLLGNGRAFAFIADARRLLLDFRFFVAKSQPITRDKRDAIRSLVARTPSGLTEGEREGALSSGWAAYRVANAFTCALHAVLAHISTGNGLLPSKHGSGSPYYSIYFD